jgi:hypothetical protein
MASKQPATTQIRQRQANTPNGDVPWEDLELTVPHDRDRASIVTLVECALVEVTHEPVGAVYVSQQRGRERRTQFIAVDEVGKQFQMQHFNDKLGWQTATVTRETVRDKLVTQLTRSASQASGDERAGSAFFTVKSTCDLEQPS